MSVHCFWRCSPVNHRDRGMNVCLCCSGREIFISTRATQRKLWSGSLEKGRQKLMEERIKRQKTGWHTEGITESRIKFGGGYNQPFKRNISHASKWNQMSSHCDIDAVYSYHFSLFLLVHQNYVGTDAEKNPFFLSVVLSDQNNQRVPQYRAILWRKSVSLQAAILTSVFGVFSNTLLR